MRPKELPTVSCQFPPERLVRKKRRFRESVRGGLRHNEKTFRERSARVQSFALFVKISRRQVILPALTVGCAGREHRVNGRVG